ncbi:MAG: M23 family metallopeptidase [bacterium]
MENRKVKIIGFLISALSSLVLPAGSLTWPIDSGITDYQRITGTFGEYSGGFHRGADITPYPCEGRPVLSAVGGTGVKIQYNALNYEGAGYNVKIFGGYGFYWYMHLARHTNIEEEFWGDPFTAPAEGSEIGLVSHTGPVGTPCHLHFQTWAGSRDNPTIALNPLIMWAIPDTNSCLFPEIQLRLESGQRVTVMEGQNYNLSGSAEFIVRAYDRSNPGVDHPNGNPINFLRLESFYDSQPLKGQDYTNSLSMPYTVGDAYSLSNPASAVPPNAWYRMGKVFLSDGTHVIRLKGYNLNNKQNETCGEIQRSFSVDTTPGVCQAHSISPLYDSFSGTTTLNPSTLETNHTISCADDISGIASLKITSLDGFDYSRTFDPPIASTNAILVDMPFGQYEITAIDAVGNETIAPFMIDSMNVSVSTAESHQYVDKSGLGPSSVDVSVSAESSAGLAFVDLLNPSDETIIQRKAVTRNQATVVFINVYVALRFLL